MIREPAPAEEEVFERMATTGKIPVVAPELVDDDGDGATLLAALAGTRRT